MSESFKRDRAAGARLAWSCVVEQQVVDALAKMMADGEPVSFYTVSKRACVARSTLYRNARLKALVVAARDVARANARSVSAADELRRRVGELEAELCRLEAENRMLRARATSSLRHRGRTEYHVVRLEVA